MKKYTIKFGSINNKKKYIITPTCGDGKITLSPSLMSDYLNVGQSSILQSH